MFAVGDRVRLTGEGWGRDTFPAAGTVAEIVRTNHDRGYGGPVGYIDSERGGYVVFDVADEIGGLMAKDWAAELVVRTPEVDQDSPLQVGDKVRLVGSGWTEPHYPKAGTVVTVDRVNGRGVAYSDKSGAMSLTDAYGQRYTQDIYGYEVVERYVEPEPERLQPQVGGQVKLTGSMWTAPHNAGFVPSGDVHEILSVANDTLVKIKDGWYVYLDPEDSHFERWGGEVIAFAPAVEATPEPLADWERELLEGPQEPQIDATGYPVGTPRAEKDVPSTAQIKGSYQQLALNDAGEESGATKSEFLAEFNRWYEQEVGEFKAEGYAEGYEAARAELEASLPQTAFVVIVGPFEEFADIDGAEARINQLADARQYATILQTVLDPETGHTVGFTVKAPMIYAAKPDTII